LYTAIEKVSNTLII